MDLQDALIPAVVRDMKVETDTHDITGMRGITRQVVTGRRVKLEIEVMPRNNDELNWQWQSLQENGNRVSLVPDGSPIIHPAILTKKALTDPPKTDQPKEVGNLIW